MTSSRSKLIFIANLSVLLNGCPTLPPNYAPVTTNQPELAPEPTKDQTPYYRVKKGDTLYAISLLVDIDYRQLAQWNQLNPPYSIEIDRKLRLSDSNPENKSTYDDKNLETQTHDALNIGETASKVERLPKVSKAGAISDTQQKTAITTATNRLDSQTAPPVSSNNKSALTLSPGVVCMPQDCREQSRRKPSSKVQLLNNSIEKSGSSPQKKSTISIANASMLKLNFQWPIKGKVLKSFYQTDNKGIDIVGEMGQDVRAAEAGKVVYSGQGLIGYGNLLIIKHNDLYLSAYANNSQLLVAEGNTVEKGEVIAKVGQAGSNLTSLHFEIRKNGKPVNPVKFLPKKP